MPAVIAAAWLFLHPKKYGLEFPKVDTTPTQFSLARESSINELTICLGNGGTRDGFFRVLRNLNPRYEPDGWIPAGAMLNATTKIVGLYSRYCVSGPRADLARALITADYALVPDDPWMYREALVDAFRVRGIFPTMATISDHGFEHVLLDDASVGATAGNRA